MRRTLLAATAMVAIMAGSSAASAADIIEEPAGPMGSNIYLSLFGGFSWISDEVTAHYDGTTRYDLDFDGGFLIGAALGTHITESVRAEIELSYSNYDADGAEDDDGDPVDWEGDVGIIYLMGNLWWDFWQAGFLTPYVGAGAGIAHVNPDAVLDDDPADNTYDEETWAVAAQVGLGVRFDLSDMFMVDLGYRFRGAFSADLDDNDGTDPLIGADFMSHNVLAGITLDF